MAEPFSLAFEGARFGAFLSEMASDVEDDQLPAFLKETMFDLIRAVIDKTPVDTGRARAGWTAFIEAEGGDVTALLRQGGDPEAIAEGKSLSDFDMDFSGAEQFVEVVNGVEYIVELEFGHSDQAPAGMVRITMREFAARAGFGEDLLDEIAGKFTAANIEGLGR